MSKHKYEGEFSVYWWSIDGTQIEEKRFVTPEEATKAVTRLIGPACVAVVHRVMVTDGGDCCCFEWIAGEVIFPKRGQTS